MDEAELKPDAQAVLDEITQKIVIFGYPGYYRWRIEYRSVREKNRIIAELEMPSYDEGRKTKEDAMSAANATIFRVAACFRESQS